MKEPTFARNSTQQREPARKGAQQREVVVPEPHEELASEDGRVEELEDSVRVLKEENLNLKIDNRGKEVFINQLVGERGQMIDKVQEISYKLGFTESRLQQLEAPKEEARNSTQQREAARGDETLELKAPNPRAREIEIAEPLASAVENKIPDASSVTAAGQPTRSIWKKLFQ